MSRAIFLSSAVALAACDGALAIPERDLAGPDDAPVAALDAGSSVERGGRPEHPACASYNAGRCQIVLEWDAFPGSSCPPPSGIEFFGVVYPAVVKAADCARLCPSTYGGASASICSTYAGEGGRFLTCQLCE